MTRVLCCGDRNWTAGPVIRERLKQFPRLTMIIEGDARGADKLSGLIALELGMPLVIVPANWDFYDKAAGPIRNRWMLDLCPDLVLAFHNHIDTSRGTADTVRESRRRGIPVEIITEGVQ